MLVGKIEGVEVLDYIDLLLLRRCVHKSRVVDPGENGRLLAKGYRV